MLPDSVLYMVNDVLVGAKTHLTWYSFATEYEDGETQFGHFIVGHDRLGIGVVANQSGVLVNSSTVNARVARGSVAPPPRHAAPVKVALLRAMR